jgi:hypothetical protein
MVGYIVYRLYSETFFKERFSKTFRVCFYGMAEQKCIATYLLEPISSLIEIIELHATILGDLFHLTFLRNLFGFTIHSLRI